MNWRSAGWAALLSSVGPMMNETSPVTKGAAGNAPAADPASARKPKTRIRGEALDRAAFLFYLCVVLVTYGAAASRYGFFPGRQLNSFFSLSDNVGSLISLHWEYRVEKLHPNEITWPEDFPAWSDVPPKIGDDDLTLIQAFRGDVYGLILVDAGGRIVHEWRIPAALDADLVKPSDRLMPGMFMVIDGAHLYPNGDVAFTVDYYGVAKIDRCSRKIWSLPGVYHHSLSIDKDGDLWVPFRDFHTDEDERTAWISKPFYNDSVAHIGADGALKETYSLVEAAIGGRYEGLLAEGSDNVTRTVLIDITHLNDADIVDAAFAERNPPAREGDILVSMRTLDAIAIIDRETRKFKYSLSGMTVRQHDPDMLANGNLLVLDNRAHVAQRNRLTYKPDGQAFGQSRVFEINPRTQEIVWSWEGTKEHPFFSSIQGKIEPLEDGNVLVVEPEGGRVFEIDRASGEIAWQFANLLEIRNGAPVYGRVTGASRRERSDLPFLDEPPCPAQ